MVWQQPLILTARPATEVPLPLELYVGWAPEIGAAHEADYERIGGEP